MNSTKIIATVGPASNDVDVLTSMALEGVNVFRINMTHSSHRQCLDIIKKINEVNSKRENKVAIMMDLDGPNVRTHRFSGGKATLRKGDKIRVYMDEVLGDYTKFSVNYSNLINDIKCNTTLKINDGKIELLVLEKDMDERCLICEVIVDGIMTDYRSVNVPGVKLNLPFLSEKDKDDIEFACKNNIDFLALSFVSTAEDVLEVNDLLISLENNHTALISKIENVTAVDEVDSIIEVSDGIMVARGDLGVELPFERVPGIQKSIIRKCHLEGKFVIVATEMMSSMEEENRPTRAEVSDVANAVIDGVDAVMLSGETTIGKHPIETVAMMYKIINSSESDMDYTILSDIALRSENQDITGAIAYSVIECAKKVGAKAIVAPTMSGYTAKKISRFRPKHSIIAVSPNEDTIKSLSIYFGIYALHIDELKNLDKIIEKAKNMTSNLLDLSEGDKIIVTGGYPFKEVKHTNFMKIEEI